MFEQKQNYTMQDLAQIVELLRDPEHGCPWDKVQTHESIRKNFLEEAYEAVDAIDLKDAHLLCEELGDVLLQVTLHARMEEELGAFSLGDVTTGICKKLIERHPHIFAGASAADPQQALDNWEAIKRREKHRETLAANPDDVPKALPALMRAQKLQKRVCDAGLRPDGAQVKESLLRHAQALCSADADDARALLGAVLFDAVCLGRMLGADAEEALTMEAEAFASRAKAADQDAAGARQIWENAQTV